jgi:rubrerythrin
MTSQMRHGMTNDPAIKRAMTKRAAIARKHLRQMAPYHKMHQHMMQDGKRVPMNCPHCNVKMVNGKCPMCGMTAKQMGGKMGADKRDGKMMSMNCPHCDVKMVNGKCPMCGMTMQQMQGASK